jgi:hypothetical protein
MTAALFPATAERNAEGVVFARGSFGGIPIPSATWAVKGGQRFVIHEYPKVPGGQLEKLGRRPYTIHMHCNAFLELNEGPSPYGIDYYPFSWNELIALFESGETAVLIVPGRGPIRAMCTNWDSSFDGQIQSGEVVDLEFTEDTFDTSAGSLLRPTISGPALSSLALALQAQAVNDNVSIPFTQRTAAGDVVSGDLFSSIFGLVTSIVAIGDQLKLQAQLVINRIDTLLSLCQLADRDPQLGRLEVSATTTALMQLWAAGAAMQRDLKATGIPLLQFLTPHTMTIDEVAIALYGATDRAEELLQLNMLDDPWRIPSGAAVNYYDAAA